ncbi:hypothetical protein Patl1_24640 [Pistacia atlantica]|uniref:Uncharacterized protein n=1 Tax=Pistacia atlantica TaxID=434234 RepID=A0ACC0ZV09_9ROSI|nr:hypothetical protein Patl1_24640 [Pistacia atlantica]
MGQVGPKMAQPGRFSACPSWLDAGGHSGPDTARSGRGQRIWKAAVEDLMAKGMHHAHQALLSGCSAGGLASILHCDEFRSFFPRNIRVKCLSDAGLFLDSVDVSGGRTLRSLYSGVVGLQGVESHLPRICTNHLDPTSCFFPQNIIGHVKTPLFILNAAYDSWQIQSSLAPPSADPAGYWHNCRLNHAKCTPSQINFLQGFRNQVLNAVKGFSMAIAIAVGDWYFDRTGVKVIDCPYPCDKTCHNLVFRA